MARRLICSMQILHEGLQLRDEVGIRIITTTVSCVVTLFVSDAPSRSRMKNWRKEPTYATFTSAPKRLLSIQAYTTTRG